MPSGAVASVLRFLRRLRGEHPAALDSDRILLERFARNRDEEAFALLLERHAAMVHGVCLRILGDPHEADDALQATFLVLARKATAVGWHESIAGWLHEVAVRVASKTRATLSRQRPLGVVSMPEENVMPDADPSSHVIERELRAILDEELAHLPYKYRAPLVLCYLEGRTNEEAAQHLGWTKGTVSGRLARGRDLLRPRLARRGLALSPLSLAAALSSVSQAAAVPAGLMEATLKASILYATTPAAAASVVTAKVLTQTEGMLKTMFVARTKIAAILVLVCLLAAATLFAYHHWTPDPPEAKDPPVKVANKAVDNPAEKPKTDQEKVQGTWHIVGVEHGGKKVPLDDVTVDTKLQIKGDRFLEFDGDIGLESIIAIDPTKTPKTIDWLQNNGGIDARTGVKTDHWTVLAVGIYELDKDTLKVARLYAELGMPGLKPAKQELKRPTGFKTQVDSQYVVTTYRRGEPPAADLPKQPEFVQAEITLYGGAVLDKPGADLKKTVKDKATLARLVACFPQMARGKKNKFAGGWLASVTIKFTGSKGEAATVSVSHNWSNWSEGQGDWLLRGNLLKQVGELFELPSLIERGRLMDPWRLVHFEENGKKRAIDNVKLGISYYDFELLQNDAEIFPIQGYSLDPTKKPKEIDLHLLFGKEERSYLGIYALEGDTLKICIDTSEKKRPTEFATTAESRRFLLVLKAR